MSKKLTITVSDDLYDALYERVGARRIGRFMEEAARENLRSRNLAAEYAEAAKDEQAEAEALEWIESNVGDTLPDEDFSDWPGYPSR